MPFHVFLSHSSADRPAVEELARRLAKEGIQAWLDEWHLIPGDPWQPAIEKALAESETCAVFVGPSGFGPWQNEEMRAAIDQRVRDSRRRFRVIPVLLPGAERAERSSLPTFLAATTWVEFRDSLDDPAAFGLLVSGIHGKMSGRIFISYRREDSSAWAGRLSDHLSNHFPSKQIFMDVDAIEPGVDFVESIERSVGSCAVLIAFIGRRWLISSDEEGRHRLDDPEDSVRLEIGTALKRGIRVIPVLVDGAVMPRSRELPDDLKSLVRRNALELSHNRFSADSERLIDAVERAMEAAWAEHQRKRLDAKQRERDEKERFEDERHQREEKEQLKAERRETEAKERLEAELRQKEEEKEQLEAEQRQGEEIERIAQRREREQRERAAAEIRERQEKEQLDTRRRQEGQEPVETEQPEKEPVAPTTSSGKRKLRPVPGILMLLALAIGLAVVTAVYFGFQRPSPKPTSEPMAQPSASASNSSAGIIPSPSPKPMTPTAAVQPPPPVATVTPSPPVIAMPTVEQKARSSLPSATKDRPWVNSLGMRFVPVLGTQVLFSIWDTRVEDFQAFVDDKGYNWTKEGLMMLSVGETGWEPRGATWEAPGFSQGPTHPVVGVSWKDATAFCEWLTKTEHASGRLPNGSQYRLPTDQEWSVAVGLDSLYPWGMKWPPPSGAGNYCGEESRIGNEPKKWTVIEGYNDECPRTSPVGRFAANKNGLYDMGGNVWQWCEDQVTSEKKLLRGASWCHSNSDNDLQASFRGKYETPDYRSDDIGFRCVVARESSR